MNKGQTETADLEQGKIVWAAQKQLFIDRGDADILKKTEWMVQTMGADMILVNGRLTEHKVFTVDS